MHFPTQRISTFWHGNFELQLQNAQMHFLKTKLFSGWMGLISGFQVEWGWMSLVIAIAIAIATACLWRRRSCFSFSPSPPKVSILCSRWGIDSEWVVWIVLLGLFRFRVAGLCGLCYWVVLIPGASILLLGLFFWFSAGGLCGFRCDTDVDYRCGSVVVWVKKWIFYLNKRVE